MSIDLSSAPSLAWAALTRLDSCASYLPFIFRLLAFLIAVPFALFIALDAIAYGIARTLHLSMSQHRVPRSPLSDSSKSLADTDNESDGKYTYNLPTPSENEDDPFPGYPTDLSGLAARLDSANLGTAQGSPSSSGGRNDGRTPLDPAR